MFRVSYISNFRYTHKLMELGNFWAMCKDLMALLYTQKDGKILVVLKQHVFSRPILTQNYAKSNKIFEKLYMTLFQNLFLRNLSLRKKSLS